MGKAKVESDGDRRESARGRARRPYLIGANLPWLRGAGFQTCRVAGLQAGSAPLLQAGLETRDTADLEVCATLNRYSRPERATMPGLGVAPDISRLPDRSPDFQSAFRVIVIVKPTASRRSGLPAFLAGHEMSGPKAPSKFQLISDGFTCFQPVALPVSGRNRQTRHSWNRPVHPSSFAPRPSSPVKPSQTQSNQFGLEWR